MGNFNDMLSWQPKWMEWRSNTYHHKELLWRNFTNDSEWDSSLSRDDISRPDESDGQRDPRNAQSCILARYYYAFRAQKRWAPFNLQWGFESRAESQSWPFSWLQPLVPSWIARHLEPTILHYFALLNWWSTLTSYIGFTLWYLY